MKKLELREAESGESPVGGVFHFSVLAERGADNADGGSAMGLNFEVAGTRFQSDGHDSASFILRVNIYSFMCMATFETRKTRNQLTLRALQFFEKRKCVNRSSRAFYPV